MSNDIPPDVKEQFRESLSFVVALDLLIDRGSDLDRPAVEEVRTTHEDVMNELMMEYSSLEPTVEGFNPATIVASELEDDGILESFPQLSEILLTMEEWFEQLDEPVTLEPEPRLDEDS